MRRSATKREARRLGDGRDGNLLSGSVLVVAIVMLFCATALAAPKPLEPHHDARKAQSLDLNEKGVAAAQSKDFTRAESLFRKSLATDPGNISAVSNLATVYLANKKEPSAVELLSTYVREFPKDSGLFAKLGDAYFASKEVKKAIPAYEKALELSPREPGVASKLGTLYSLSNRLPDAERMFLKAVEEEPKNVRHLANLSSLLLANGKPEKAVSTAKKALQMKASSELYVTLGNAYEALSDPKNALIAFQRAADLGDKRPEVQAKIDDLRKLEVR